MELDRIDFALIDLLQKDARLSNKELAAAVGLAPSSCLARVQRLRSEGVLKGAHAEVNPETLGIGLQALIAVQLRQHSRAQVKAFWKHMMGLPEVLTVFHVAGTHDFQVHVAVRDAHHLRDLALDGAALMKLAGRPGGPWLGELQRQLLVAVLDDPGLNRAEALAEVARKLMPPD